MKGLRIVLVSDQVHKKERRGHVISFVKYQAIESGTLRMMSTLHG